MGKFRICLAFHTLLLWFNIHSTSRELYDVLQYIHITLPTCTVTMYVISDHHVSNFSMTQHFATQYCATDWNGDDLA